MRGAANCLLRVQLNVRLRWFSSGPHHQTFALAVFKAQSAVKLAKMNLDRLLILVQAAIFKPHFSLPPLAYWVSGVLLFFNSMKEYKLKPVTEPASRRPELSIFLPVYNEEENIDLLNLKLKASLQKVGRTYEIIYIDDGSSDASLAKLRDIAALDNQVRVIALRRNYGQTAAMSAGIDFAHGDILIPMDADLQNDPEDIARLLEKLDEGYDVVSGWRKDRQDKMITRRIPSTLANRLISVISGVHLHDYGCSLKAYRRDVLEDVKLYGEMHRFIPIYAKWAGARVTEIPVTHHARHAGKSKYGLSRTIKVVFDLITIKFMASYWTKPLYLFGTGGAICLAVSFVAFIAAMYYRFVEDIHLNRMPLATLTMVMFAMGIQFIFMGLIAEMVVRTYHESQDKPTYLVREKINVEENDANVD